MAATQHTVAVRAAIEAMDNTVLMARALIEGGRRIDLAGLDQDATALCAAVMALDANEAKRLRPSLVSLRTRLDSLAASIARG
jgi:streptomycin 6-kinase